MEETSEISSTLTSGSSLTKHKKAMESRHRWGHRGLNIILVIEYVTFLVPYLKQDRKSLTVTQVFDPANFSILYHSHSYVHFSASENIWEIFLTCAWRS